MKKKFLSFILAICLILPCAFMLAACGGDNTILTVKFEYNSAYNATYLEGLEFYDATTYSINNQETVAFYDVHYGKHEVQLKKGQQYLVMYKLKEGYDVGSLKMYINGVESYLRPVHEILQEIGNPAASEFLDLEYYADYWPIQEDAVDSIEVSFSGRPEIKRYQVSIGTNINYTQPAFKDMFFQLIVGGEIYKNEQGQETYGAEDFAGLMTDLGTKKFQDKTEIVVKAGYTNKNITFDAGQFMKFENRFGQEYNFDCYYDPIESVSVYKHTVTAWVKIHFDNYVGDQDFTKANLYLSGVESHVLDDNDTPDFISIEDILANGAVYTVENFSYADYKVVMKPYTNAMINQSIITQAQKEQIFSWSDGNLTVNLGKLRPIDYAHSYDPTVFPGKLLSFVNVCEYNIQFSVDNEALKQDETIGKINMSFKYKDDTMSVKDIHFYEAADGSTFSIEQQATNTSISYMNTGDDPGLVIYDVDAEEVEIYLHYCSGTGDTVVSKTEININGQKVIFNQENGVYQHPTGSVSGATIALGEEFNTISIKLTKALITSISNITIEFFGNN